MVGSSQTRNNAPYSTNQDCIIAKNLTMFWSTAVGVLMAACFMLFYGVFVSAKQQQEGADT